MTDFAALHARFPLLAPRDQSTVLRALVDLGESAQAVALASSVEGAGLAVLDLHAEALLAANRPADALAVVESREKRGQSSVSLGLRSRALSRLGRVAEARAAVESAGDRTGYLARCILAEALLEAGEAAQARRELEAAVAEAPHRRRALAGLVAACEALGDWVTGSAFAARLLAAAEGEEEGELSTKYLARLRAFYAATREANRVAELDDALAERRKTAEGRIAAALSGTAPAAAPRREPRAEPAPRASPPIPAPAALPDLPPAKPVSGEELANASALVKRHFGFSALREGQAETIARALRGEDVLAILPTGGGKSVCYQLPGVLARGVTLVVSPLIALMKDQLDSLPAPMRAASASLTSELPPGGARRVLDDVARGHVRLLYVAPERLRQPSLLGALRRAGVARLVVDEAHCVSVWGHDFRPDYLGIADARRALGNPPLLAVTATAPPRVLRDVLNRLGELTVVRASIHRPNLRFEAVLASDADEKLQHLLALCRETKGPGIVYASSRAKCEQLAAALASAGLRADAYHAGMPDRAERQERFMRGDVDVLVATVAFGMGIDKGDLRFVIHHDPASSLESYYQEAGRAGRDGAPARCVVLATGADGGTLKQRARQDLPTRDLVQRAWELVKRSDAGDGYAMVDFDALPSLDPEDAVKPRVALSILAEAGAIERLADAPRVLKVHGGGPALASVQGRETSVFEVAPLLGVGPERAEAALLDRESAGDLFFQSGGRALLYRVKVETPEVDAVMDRYVALAEQRGKEMMDFVKTTRCRHAYLRAYFGEAAPATCDACDNCLGVRHALGEEAAQDDEAARKAVLDALASVKGIGELNLVYMLRGDARAADWVARKSAFGSLAFRSESRIKALVKELERLGYVGRETLAHGGTSLKITDKGAEAMFSGRPLGSPDRPAPARARAPAPDRAPAPARERAPAPDPAPERATPALSAGAAPAFEALRAWRRERADAEGVPPYVIAHDATLRAIAELKPATTAALAGVKGMGPKRVEKYGEEILAALRGD